MHPGGIERLMRPMQLLNAESPNMHPEEIESSVIPAHAKKELRPSVHPAPIEMLMRFVQLLKAP